MVHEAKMYVNENSSHGGGFGCSSGGNLTTACMNSIHVHHYNGHCKYMHTKQVRQTSSLTYRYTVLCR